MRNTFLSIDKQLSYLMQTHEPPINTADELSKLMYDAGILEYSSKKGVTHEESIRNSAKTINNHRNGLRVSTEWINHYCEYFKCSADYLYGVIEYPTHEITDIVSEIGLDAESITRLQRLNEYRNFNSGLCKLIKCDSFGEFMMNWEQYLSSDDLYHEYQLAFRQQLIEWGEIKEKDVLTENELLLLANKYSHGSLRDISLKLLDRKDELDYMKFKLQESVFSLERDSANSGQNKSTR